MKTKKLKIFALKMFIITFLISVGFSVITELFLSDLGLIPAILIVVAIIFIGIIFDIIGVGFASCDHTPFIAMSFKEDQKGQKSA